MKGALARSVLVALLWHIFAGDNRKLKFTTEAFSMSDPTLPCKRVPVAVDAAISWVASATAESVCAYRECVVSEIEQLGRELRNSGACDRCMCAIRSIVSLWAGFVTLRWLMDCHVDARAVVRDMNGPLLVKLLQKYKYHDPDCVQLFQQGVLLLIDVGRVAVVGPFSCQVRG